MYSVQLYLRAVGPVNEYGSYHWSHCGNASARFQKSNTHIHTKQQTSVNTLCWPRPQPMGGFTPSDHAPTPDHLTPTCTPASASTRSTLGLSWSLWLSSLISTHLIFLKGGEGLGVRRGGTQTLHLKKNFFQRSFSDAESNFISKDEKSRKSRSKLL